MKKQRRGKETKKCSSKLKHYIYIYIYKRAKRKGGRKKEGTKERQEVHSKFRALCKMSLGSL